jgi:hypothetical protein
MKLTGGDLANGTLRQEKCPSLVKNKAEHFGQHSGFVSAVLAWRDKKGVTMI